MEDNFEKLIESELRAYQGLVIGEYNYSFAPLEFLIKYAPVFETLGVKYIFSEKHPKPQSYSQEESRHTDGLSNSKSSTSIETKEIMSIFFKKMDNANIRTFWPNQEQIDASTYDSKIKIAMIDLITSVIKSDEKFLVLSNVSHVSRLINKDKNVSGICELLMFHRISCRSVHIYESCFFEKEYQEALFFDHVKYKIGDMQNNQALYAGTLIGFDGQFAHLSSPPVLKIREIIPDENNPSATLSIDNTTHATKEAYSKVFTPNNISAENNSNYTDPIVLSRKKRSTCTIV